MDVEKRRVVLKPPANVWRYLRMIPNSGIHVLAHETWKWLLELLKACYGLNDAPLAFQACEGEFFIKDLAAIRSRYDDNFYWWSLNPGAINALATTHVDDNEIGTPRTPEGREWREETHSGFEKKFGKTGRTKLPAHHCGLRYQEVQYQRKQ